MLNSKMWMTFSGYFYYYYDFSDPILLIPNIKIERYDIVTKKKIPIISIDDS